MLMSGGRVEAHGNFDQSLNGDPGCNSSNFPASAGVSSSPRQEFVPSGTLVSSVGVCLGSAGGATVDIAVRSGTAGSPGSVLGVVAALPVPAGTTSFVHADFLSPLTVSAGGTYVIEVISSGDVAWLGSSGDEYAAGGTNAALGDLAFRSYLAPGAAVPTATNTVAAQPTSTATRAATRTPAATSTTAAGTSTAVPATVTPAAATGSTQLAAADVRPTGSTAAAVTGAAPMASGQAAAPVAGSGAMATRGGRIDAWVMVMVSIMALDGCLLVYVARRGQSG
jgi:hypothetical protein